MNLAELNKVAEAMVAPGRGILAADESSGTIKKRFDAIGVENTEDNRRDYRELMFRTGEAMSKIHLRRHPLRRDDPPEGQGRHAAGQADRAGRRAARHQGRQGHQAAALLPGEVITEGLDGLRERLAEYRNLGAKFAKWRAVIDIGAGIPSYTAIKANAHALARYAALCQDEQIVPIVEPEVLMDGEHDIDRCYSVTEWVLKATFEELYYNRVALEGMVLKPNMAIAGKKSAKKASRRGGRREDRAAAQGLRAGRGPRHRVPLRRPVRRGGDRASRRHEQARRRCPGSSPSPTAAPCRPRRRRPGAASPRTSRRRSAPSRTARG